MSEAIDIQARLETVQNHIADACERSGRSRDEVTLVAVSKTRTVDEICRAYDAGVRHLGENRVGEAQPKVEALQDKAITWHMIGHIQSRKAEAATEWADVIHSVDSLKLARRLDRFAGERDKTVPILLELNVSGEESKYGYPAWEVAQLEALLDEARTIVEMEHLMVRGLMTVAPIAPDPEQVRPFFRRLSRWRDYFREQLPQFAWDELSMGMTDDYVVAIEEGATMVRIGRAIFGPRDY